MAWSRESRHARGYGTAWDKIRKRIMERDNYLCQPCKAKGVLHPANEVDHIIPKSKGGTDDPDNLQAIASSCHRTKTAEEKGHKVKPRIALDGWPEQG